MHAQAGRLPHHRRADDLRRGSIEFNAHRNYGWERLAHVKGFELVGYPEQQCNYIPAGGTDAVIVRKGAALQGEGAPKLSSDDFARAPVLGPPPLRR